MTDLDDRPSETPPGLPGPTTPEGQEEVPPVVKAIFEELKTLRDRQDKLSNYLLKIEEASKSSGAEVPRKGEGGGGIDIMSIVDRFLGEVNKSEVPGHFGSFYQKYHENADKVLVDALAKLMRVGVGHTVVET